MKFYNIFLIGLATTSINAAPPPIATLVHSGTAIAISDSSPATATGLAILEKRDECNTCRRNCKLKQAFWPWTFLPWRMKKWNKRCQPTCKAAGQDKDSHKHKHRHKTTQKTEKCKKTEKTDNDNDNDKDAAVVEQTIEATDEDMADFDTTIGVDMTEDDLDKEFEKVFVDYFGRKPTEKELSDMRLLDEFPLA